MKHIPFSLIIRLLIKLNNFPLINSDIARIGSESELSFAYYFSDILLMGDWAGISLTNIFFLSRTLIIVVNSILQLGQLGRVDWDRRTMASLDFEAQSYIHEKQKRCSQASVFAFYSGSITLQHIVQKIDFSTI